jgi:hypothetical protein
MTGRAPDRSNRPPSGGFFYGWLPVVYYYKK